MMLDIVLSDGIGKERGISEQIIASELNFESSCSREKLRAHSRVPFVLLHSPSYQFDPGIFIELKRRGGAVAFAFSDLLPEKGFRRAILISKMRITLSEAQRVGANYIFCTLAKCNDSARNAREIEAFGSVIGASRLEMLNSQSVLEAFAKRKGRKAGRKLK